MVSLGNETYPVPLIYPVMDPVQVPVRSGTVVSGGAVVEQPATTMTINNAKRNKKKPFMVYTCLLPEIIKYLKKSKNRVFLFV